MDLSGNFGGCKADFPYRQDVMRFARGSREARWERGWRVSAQLVSFVVRSANELITGLH